MLSRHSRTTFSWCTSLMFLRHRKPDALVWKFYRGWAWCRTENRNCPNPGFLATSQCTGLPNKVCPRLRDSACWRSGEITQPRTSLIREPCTLLSRKTARGCYRAGSCWHTFFLHSTVYTKLEVFVDKTVRYVARGRRGETRVAAQQKSARSHAPFYP